MFLSRMTIGIAAAASLSVGLAFAGSHDQSPYANEIGARKAQTIAIASVALRGWLNPLDHRLGDLQIALGAVAPTVIYAGRTAECLMAGPLTEKRLMEAGEIAARECHPIDDLRGSAAYRRRLVRGLLVRGLWPHVAP